MIHSKRLSASGYDSAVYDLVKTRGSQIPKQKRQIKPITTRSGKACDQFVLLPLPLSLYQETPKFPFFVDLQERKLKTYLWHPDFRNKCLLTSGKIVVFLVCSLLNCKQSNFTLALNTLQVVIVRPTTGCASYYPV